MAIARGPQGPIQRTFGALLGLLDLKGSEVSPNTIAGFTQPVIDTTPFLLGGMQRVSRNQGTWKTGDVNPSPPQFRVPEGKTWVLSAASATCEMQIGDTLGSVGIYVTFPGSAGGGVLVIAEAPHGVAVATQDGYVAACFQGLLTLPGGSTVDLQLGNATAAAPRPSSLTVMYAQVNS